MQTDGDSLSPSDSRRMDVQLHYQRELSRPQFNGGALDVIALHQTSAPMKNNKMPTSQLWGNTLQPCNMTINNIVKQYQGATAYNMYLSPGRSTPVEHQSSCPGSFVCLHQRGSVCCQLVFTLTSFDYRLSKAPI